MTAPLIITNGDIELPAMTLDGDAWRGNLAAVLDYCRQAGVGFAPHAKTAMIPAIAAEAVSCGAFGASVADVKQADAILKGGVKRIIIANQVVGKAAITHLAHLIRDYSDAQFFVFVDSSFGVDRLAAAARLCGRPINALVELGGGRGGVRSLPDARHLAEQIDRSANLRLAGVASYEGSVADSDPVETASRIRSLLQDTVKVAAWMRERWPDHHLILSAGGSLYLDFVVEALVPAAQALGNADVIVRSGAILFHDHGVYERGIGAMQKRGLAGTENMTGGLRPALRVWADVLSRPEPGLAIAGAGMRHLSFDQGLPVVLAIYRNGIALPLVPGSVVASRLNDQHIFLTCPPDAEVAPGDILELGISHPCTAMDRWRTVLEINNTDQTVILDTCF